MHSKVYVCYIREFIVSRVRYSEVQPYYVYFTPMYIYTHASMPRVIYTHTYHTAQHISYSYVLNSVRGT